MKRIFFIPVLFFIGFLAIVYFVFPKYNQVKTLKHEVLTKERELKERQIYFSDLQTILSKLENYKEALAIFNTALPKNLSEVSLLNFFQLSTSENGLILDGIPGISFLQEDSGAEEGLLKLKEANFSIGAKGSVASFENFLRVLEKSSRLIDVESIALPDATDQLMDFSIVAKVYYY